jgi:transcriptional regulator with XRE-family HTH domain
MVYNEFDKTMEGNKMSEYEIGLYRIIGEMIRDIRETKGLTLDQIAGELSVTPKTIQRYEKGERKIKISTIMELSNVLGFDYDMFMAEAKARLAGNDKTELPSYYLNDETREIAQEIFENKELRILFDASRKAKPEDLLFAAEMIKKLKEKGNNN